VAASSDHPESPIPERVVAWPQMTPDERAIWLRAIARTALARALAEWEREHPDDEGHDDDNANEVR